MMRARRPRGRSTCRVGVIVNDSSPTPIGVLYTLLSTPAVNGATADTWKGPNRKPPFLAFSWAFGLAMERVTSTRPAAIHRHVVAASGWNGSRPVGTRSLSPAPLGGDAGDLPAVTPRPLSIVSVVVTVIVPVVPAVIVPMLLDASAIEHDAQQPGAAVPDAFERGGHGFPGHHLRPDHENDAVRQRAEDEGFGYGSHRWRVDHDPGVHAAQAFEEAPHGLAGDEVGGRGAR